jgi:acyl-homoserine-lactone acylase
MGHRRGSWLAVVTVGIVAIGCTDDGDSSDTTTASTSAPTTVADTEPATSATVADSEPETTPPDTEATAPDTAPDVTIEDFDYTANITRTSYGVAHIVADDWAGLGFGQGYAFAQDRACTLIDQVIKVRGERAMWFGPGDGDRNLDTDFAYRALGLWEDAPDKYADQPENIAQMVEGYVAGFNAELAEEGPHGWCEGEPWVQEITEQDLYAYLNDVTAIASAGALITQIGTAQPPADETSDTSDIPTVPGDTSDIPVVPTDSSDIPVEQTTTTLGSNGWAIGSELSDSGGGMLLANPHFPWEGEKRLWESHLTLTTGELDAYGATLSGVPGVLIGFNDAVAWTHTVSAGNRFTLYGLDLVPGDPTSYVYGDETRAMTGEDITIEVLQDDGSTEEVTRTMWQSHYGAMLNLPFGWTAEKAYTMRDANIDNTDVLRQFFGMATATSMDEFIQAHAEVNAIPWVNTIAASADGRAWYADASAAPNLSDETLAAWQAEVDAGGLASAALGQGAILLNGSDPMNEWVDDPDAARPGILPFDEQPTLEREDFVFNANDSHWLANPDELLTGFPRTTGREEYPQSSRTRMNVVLLTDPEVRGEDELLSLDEITSAILSQRSLHAELLAKDVVAACDRVPTVQVDGADYDLTGPCDVLREWDGAFTTDAVGAVLWREFLAMFGSANRSNAGTLYSVPFDPADPVGTPNTLNADDVAVLTNLGIAAKRLDDTGYGYDAVLGDMQYDARPHEFDIPVGGGLGLEGVASVVGCCSNPNTLAPKAEFDDDFPFDENFFRSESGYPVTFGNSFMMTLQFTDDGPVAQGLLTYGQPDDLESDDFTSQTALYSESEFRPMWFTPQEIEADAVDSYQVVGNR